MNPLKRPRLGRTGIYSPTENQTELIMELRELLDFTSPVRQPLVIDLYICFKKIRPIKPYSQGTSPIYPVAQKYGDEDNLRKAVMDALVKAEVIADDRFVVGGETYKIFDKEDWFYLAIYEAGDPVVIDV